MNCIECGHNDFQIEHEDEDDMVQMTTFVEIQFECQTCGARYSNKMDWDEFECSPVPKNEILI